MVYISLIIKRTLFFLLIITSIISCKKFIEVDFPVTSSNAAVVYNTDAQAIGVLTGIFVKMNNQILSNGYINGVSLFTGLSADELALFDLNNTSLNAFYSNALSSQSSSSTFWATIYPVIFSANSALEGLNTSSDLTPLVKQQLIGEAKFIRAFCYFYLINLYGDVPLALTTDYKVNTVLSKASKVDIYNKIIADLKDAQDLLSANYLNGNLQSYTSNADKVRPTKWASATLLARSYLYIEDWANAESQASSVISNTTFSLDSLNGVFFKNSKEAIWQFQSVRNGAFSNTLEGAIFVLPSTGPSSNTYPVYLSNNILSSFETGDQRKIKWTSSVKVTIAGVPTTFFYPNKYKIGQVTTANSEYSTVFRLGEVYLIRAEARAQLDKTSDAVSDLNSIRRRAGLSDYSGPTDKNSLLAAILHERQVELFTEWGHRWFDLKRTGVIDVVMPPITTTKGGSWQATDQLYPIPQTELDRSPNVNQNEGYN